MARFFLFLSALSLSLLGAELYFRNFRPEFLSHSLQFASEGHLWNSGVSGTYKWRDFVMKLTFNTSGERDSKDHSTVKTSDRKRLLFLGDSLTYGWPLDQEYSFFEILKTRFPDWDFINCSSVTLSSVQLLEVYANRCAKYDVDLVILQVTLMDRAAVPAFMFGSQLGSDFLETSILYDLKGAASLESVFVDEFGLFKRTLSPEEVSTLRKLFRPLLPAYSQWHFVRKIEHTLIWPWRYRFRAQGSLMEFGKSSFDRAQIFAERAGLSSRMGRELKPNPELELQILKRFEELAKERGAKFATVVLPNALGINLFTSHPVPSLAGETPLANSKIIAVKSAFEKVLNDSRKRGLAIYDLASVFPTERYEDYFLISQDDVHPSAAGHQWIAGQLAPLLTKLQNKEKH